MVNWTTGISQVRFPSISNNSICFYFYTLGHVKHSFASYAPSQARELIANLVLHAPLSVEIQANLDHLNARKSHLRDFPTPISP